MPTYGFAGREPDATGLIYLRARYYDPDTGRFTQPDPLGFIDGINRYAYAKNSPVNFVDPWGTTAREPSGFIDATLNYYSNNPDELVLLGLGFTPAGFFLDLGTLLTGRDVITGEAVPWYWGAVGMIPAASELRKASNAVNTVSEIADVAAKLPGPASGIVGDAVKSAGALGREGEAAVRSAYDIGEKTAFNIGGRTRIPDGINEVSGVLSEVKNVESLSFTRQLRDYMEYSKQQGFRFDLYTRPDTRLSAPLQNAIDSGFINHVHIPQ